jgi:class 3 adenylate cyclase
VTLLFADIAGFTGYSSKVQPEQVVYMLRNLFTEFDKICLDHNLYKLYTIGDCYVVMGLVDGDP